MPESEPEKKTVHAGTPDSSGADKRKSEPDKNASGPSATSAPGKKQPIPRRAKWMIALLLLLCLILLAALVELACLPHFLEQDINKILQPLAEGGGVEFRIKTISLTSAEVACKIRDYTRDGRPMRVGSIGSLSIRYSPLSLLRDRSIESIDIENCDVTADYSDGSVSIPAYDLFAKSFQSDEKEKEESAPVDDLNAVIPVKVGKISLSGSLAAVARGEDAVDNLHIPYAVTVTPDPEQGWNRLECSLMVHFATNGIRCKAVYLHREKKVELNLDDFSLATSALPGAVRSGMPRGLRAGVSLSAKAEIDLNSLNLEELENSSLDLNGELTFAYRTPQGLRIDSAAPFSLKTVPRVIPTVKPMNPPKTENDIVFTLGTLKGEYDKIPFEVGDIKADVSLPKRTVKGSFQVKVAESEPAEFSFGGYMDEEKKGFELKLENRPLFHATYKGADVSFRAILLSTGASIDADGKITGSATFDGGDLLAGFEGGALSPELKGLTASFDPKSFSINAVIRDSMIADSLIKFEDGELRAEYKNMTFSFKQKSLYACLKGGEGEDPINIGGGFHDGELVFEKEGIKATFLPEAFSADANFDSGFLSGGMALTDAIRYVHAELKGGKLLASSMA